jgi:hypothetical protein
MSEATTAPPLVPILIFGAVVAAVGIGVSLAYAYEKKRTAALADACLRMGFDFQPKVPKERIPTLGSFHLFNVGRGRSGFNLMTGKADGAPVSIFDYRYTVGGGKSSHTFVQTVAVFPGVGGLPEFVLAPEHWWDKLGQALGMRDINFEASPEFSKSYILKGPDEARIRTAFGAEALGFLAQNPAWSVEVKGDAILIYRLGSRPKVEEMPQFVAEVAAVRRALVHD